MNRFVEVLATFRTALVRYRRLIGFAVGAIIIVAVIAIALAAYVARETMPTDRLYSLKVNVYEPTVMMTKTTAASKSEYAAELISTRFEELLHLRDAGMTDVSIISPLIARTSETIAIAIQSIRESNLQNEDRIDDLLAVSVPVKAMETIAQTTDALDPSEDAFEELRKTMSQTIAETVRGYASSTDTERVKVYLGAHIENVTALLPTVAEGSAAQRQALARIEDMRAAVEEGNIADALIAILRAEEGLTVDGMVWGSERGEGPNTAPIASTTEGQ